MKEKTKIHMQEDCGNAPRRRFLRDFYTAVAHGDADFASAHIANDLQWRIVGQQSISSRACFLEEFKKHHCQDAKELTIDTIITHGRDASVSGWVLLSDDSRIFFSDIYRFKGAAGTTINSITTFLIRS